MAKIEEEYNVSAGRVQRPLTFLDFAKATYNGDQQEWIVEEVKLLRNAFIIIILLFPYKFIFYQVNERLYFESNIPLLLFSSFTQHFNIKLRL